MKMRKIFIFFVVIFFVSCSNLNKKNHWLESQKLIEYSNKLQTGDILVKEKVWYKPIAWFGHCGIMISDKYIGEYPKLGVGYVETGAMDWLYERRKVTVLRYKKFDEKFKRQFLKNVETLKGKIYRIKFDNYDENSFYCSKYIWYLYYKTAKDLGYELDLIEKERSFLIFPYDFLKTNKLENIDLTNKK